MVARSIPQTSSIPNAISFRAQHNSDKAAFLWLNDQDSEVTITYKELSDACGRVASSFGGLLPTQRVDEVVAIVGNVDTVVHQTLLTGLMSANLVVRTSLISSAEASVFLIVIPAVCDFSAVAADRHRSSPQVNRLPSNPCLQAYSTRVSRWYCGGAEDSAS